MQIRRVRKTKSRAGAHENDMLMRDSAQTSDPTNTKKPNFPQVVAHTGISGYLLVHTALSLLTGAFVPRHVYTQIFDKYAIAACNTDFRQPQLESCKIYILVILIILYSRNILPQGIIVLFTQRLLT